MSRARGRRYPTFRERSRFDGIARRQVGRDDLVVHSLTVLTPALSALGTGLALPALVGPGFWVSILLGFALAWMQAVTFEEFASRFGAAGSLGTFVARGLGATTAMVVTVALLLGYGSFIAFGLTGAAHRVELTVNAGGGDTMGQLIDMGLVMVFALFCLLVIRRGLVPTTRIALAVQALSAVVLVVVLVATMVRFGPPTLDSLSLAGASFERILIGAALIATLTVAFECCATLSLETRRPLGAVPASMRRSLVLTGAVVLAAAVIGAARPVELAWSWRWFGQPGATSILDSIVLAALATSLVTMALCAWTALSRLVFSLAREGMVWSRLGQTNAAGVPVAAVTCTIPLVVGLPIAAWAVGLPVTVVAWELLRAATMVMCLAYAVTAVAVVPFLRSIDELRPRSVAVAAVTATGSAAVAVEKLATEGLVSLKAVTLVAVVAVGLLWRWALVASPRDTADPGAYDEPIHADALLPR